MNILFTADIHANKTRLNDVLTFLDKCKEIIINEKINTFVIGGDLWNSMVPNTLNSGFVDILNKFVEITGLGINVVAIYGTPSHEPNGCLDFLKPLGVNVISGATLEETFDGNFLFIPEPRRADFIKQSSSELNQAIIDYLSKTCSQKADVIFYHGEISGAHMDNGMTCKSDTKLTREMIEKTGAQLTLAGHIHTPQSPFNGCHYVGSPIPCNFGESHEGSVIAFSINNHKISNFRRIPTGAPVKKYFEIQSLKELAALENFNLSNSDVKIKVNLTPQEKLTFKIRDTAALIKEQTNARSVIINTFVNKDVSVRSKEIAKAVTTIDKLKIYAKVNNIKLRDSVIEKAKSFEDCLYINYTFPSHSFELISLDLKGAKGLKKKEQIFIDFSKFDNGLVALIGENGSGKTTLLEMASPFPYLLTRSGALRTHFYLKDSHKIVVFKDETGLYYKFTILLTAHTETGLVKYFAETSEDGEVWKSVPSCTGNLTDYQDYVESLFGDVSLYLRTAFFTKGNTKGTPDIASATKSQRITLLSQLLGTENLSTLHAMVNDKLKEIKNQTEKLSGVDEKYKELDEKEKLKLTNVSRINKEINEVESNLDLLRKDLPDLQKKADDFNEKYKNAAKPEDIKAKSEERIKDLSELLDKLNKHKEDNDFFLSHQSEIDSYRDSYNKFQEISKEVKKLSDKRIAESEKAQQTFKILNSLEPALQNARNKKENVQNRIKTLQDAIVPIAEECPYCGAKLTLKKKKELLAEQDKNNLEIAELNLFIKKQEDFIKDLESQVKEARRNHKAQSDKEVKAIENYDEANGRYVATGVYLDMNDVYKSFLNYVPVTNLISDIERVSEDLKKEQDMLKSIESETFRDYNEELQILTKQLKDDENTLNKLIQDKATFAAEASLIREQKAEIEEQKNAMKSLMNDYDDYSILEKAFSNSGIQALELEAAAPSIAELTNQILKDSYGDKFTVSFSTLKQGREKVIDDFAINVTNNESGWTTPIELLSEGEKTWIIQSLYYAFSLIRMEKTGFSFRVRFVDESDGALDSDMRLKYVSMIESAHKAGNARLTVMITHSQEIKDIVGQTINL